MTKNPMSNERSQFRLVRELKDFPPGRLEIKTYQPMGKPKEGTKEDKTSELLNESAALKLACDYCKRGEKRKGLPAEVEFRGIVVTRFIGDPKGAVPVPRNIPYRRIGGRRPPRVKGTTKWLYYIEPECCKAFHVDTISGKHYKGEPL